MEDSKSIILKATPIKNQTPDIISLSPYLLKTIWKNQQPWKKPTYIGLIGFSAWPHGLK